MGLTAQLVWQHPGERAATLLFFPQGRAGNRAEQNREKEKKSWEFRHDRAKGLPRGSLTGATLAPCCAQGGTSRRSSHLRLQSPPSQLCSAIRHLIMQHDAIAQFLQVSGPALTPTGAESQLLRSSSSSVPLQHPRQKHFPHRHPPVSAGQGTAASPACAAHASRGAMAAVQPHARRSRGSAGLVPARRPSAARCPRSSTGPGARWMGTARHRRAPDTQGRREGGRRSSSEVSRGSPGGFVLAPHRPRRRTAVQEPLLPSVPGTPAPSPCLCSPAPRPPAQRSRSGPPGSCCRRACCRCGTSPASLPPSGRWWSRGWTRPGAAWSSAWRRERSVSAAGRWGGGPGGSRDLPHVTSSPTSPRSRERGGGPRAGASEGEPLCFYLQDAENGAPLVCFPFPLPSSPQGVQSTQLIAGASDSTRTHTSQGKLRHGETATCLKPPGQGTAGVWGSRAPGKPQGSPGPAQTLTRRGAGRSLRVSTLFVSLIFIS